jgi:hypothetical protein
MCTLFYFLSIALRWCWNTFLCWDSMLLAANFVWPFLVALFTASHVFKAYAHSLPYKPDRSTPPMYKEISKIPTSENCQFSSSPKMDGKFGFVVITIVKMSTGVVYWSFFHFQEVARKPGGYYDPGGTPIRGVIRSGLYGIYKPLQPF